MRCVWIGTERSVVGAMRQTGETYEFPGEVGEELIARGLCALVGDAPSLPPLSAPAPILVPHEDDET